MLLNRQVSPRFPLKLAFKFAAVLLCAKDQLVFKQILNVCGPCRRSSSGRSDIISFLVSHHLGNRSVVPKEVLAHRQNLKPVLVSLHNRWSHWLARLAKLDMLADLHFWQHGWCGVR